MNSEAKRKQVYNSWVVFRHLAFNRKSILTLVNENAVRVMILVGRFDMVIQPEKLSTFAQHLKHGRMEILEAGHNQVLRVSEPVLIKRLLS
jgi:pimeloyl-ACP methyl ester carboxylesterase